MIHVVQQGDSITSIANQYGVSAERLIIDNELNRSKELVIGQTIVIVYPEKVYTVMEGDSLSSIAKDQGITLIQLLRNNPYLSDREYIYPGELLVISYDNNKGMITTNGYANTFIDMSILKKTLPLLTYLSVFGNRAVENANIVEVDDEDLITMAKEYHVAPIMLLSTMSAQGTGSLEISYKLLTNEQLINKHIENILRILQKKGYYGVNLTYQFINESNIQIYENYTNKVTKRLHEEGYTVFLTLSINVYLKSGKLTFDKLDLSNIFKMVDGITLMNYNWGYSFGPPGPVASVQLLKEYADYIIQLIPPEKVEIGIPIIGYDWELPYVIGVTRANSLTNDSALNLAREVGAVIQFDEVSQTPHFEYIEEKDGIPRQHTVWFIDARSIQALLDLVKGYGFRGTGVWNIMTFYSQLWLITNSEYEIETKLT